LLGACPQADHQAAQKLGFELRVGWSGLPDGASAVAGAALHHLYQAAVADENLGLAVGGAL
jgi:hypothetical protein